MYHLSAHTPRRRGRVPSFRHPCGAHPSNQPSPTNLKLNSRPRGRRDAGDLHHARAPLLRFLAVTTLVATLSQETPEGPSRPAVVLLSAEDVAERPLDSVHTPGLLPWAAMLGEKARRKARRSCSTSAARVLPCSIGTSDDVFRLTGSSVRTSSRLTFVPPAGHAPLIKRREPRAPLSFLRGAFSVARFFRVNRKSFAFL